MSGSPSAPPSGDRGKILCLAGIMVSGHFRVVGDVVRACGAARDLDVVVVAPEQAVAPDVQGLPGAPDESQRETLYSLLQQAAAGAMMTCTEAIDDWMIDPDPA